MSNPIQQSATVNDAIWPLVPPEAATPVDLRELNVGTPISHGLRFQFQGQWGRWCSCCDEWRPGALNLCPECLAPFERGAA